MIAFFILFFTTANHSIPVPLIFVLINLAAGESGTSGTSPSLPIYRIVVLFVNKLNTGGNTTNGVDTGVAAAHTPSEEAAKETVMIVVPVPTMVTRPVDELMVATLELLLAYNIIPIPLFVTEGTTLKEVSLINLSGILLKEITGIILLGT
jgi:hypothetical protein